jgi:hypothetical protein
VLDWAKEGKEHWELLMDLPDIVARFAPGETFDDFLRWMVEHCPSAIFVARHERGNAIENGGMTFEYLISEENQAFAFKMRWT